MQGQFRIPIRIGECAGCDRLLEPVRIGVPLPKGLLRDVSGAVLADEAGRRLPFQARELACWPDRSIKWLLVDALASVRANERLSVFLCDSLSSAAAGVDAIGVRLKERGTVWEIDTGAATFEVGGDPAALLDAARVSGVDLLDRAGVSLLLTGCTGRQYCATLVRRRIEERGSVRVTVAGEGYFEPERSGRSGQSRPPLLFKSRLIFNAGRGCVRLEITIHNPKAAKHPGGLWDLNDQGTLLFEDISLSLKLEPPARELRWQAEPGQESHSEMPGDWFLYQDSSGGENWDSDNHIDGKGALTVTFRGYRVEYGDESGSKLIAEGDRATPSLCVATDQGLVSIGTPEFWECFPKALRWNAGVLEVGLFPCECRAPFALQGGEQKRHAVLLDFASPGLKSSLPELRQPLEASIDPTWVERSGALECFVAESRDPNRRYLDYIQSIIEGPERFEAKREVIDEFGWRHYGDLYADHESVGCRDARPRVSHYNNQYDFVYGALVHFLRTGDHRWWRLADAAARHTIDIDIYHTDDDRTAFNHGLFWHTDHYRPAATCTHRTYSGRNGRKQSYGGGPSNEHNYTSGLALYFYLTGDPEAALAVRELAEWVIAMDAGNDKASSREGTGPTGLASKTADPSYHKPGRGGGNSINALLDAWQLSAERKYLDKAEELIRRCIHPADDIEALHLGEPELRWSYLVFLQALGKYLHLKLEWAQIDDEFRYARASLLHYARWMFKHEVPYKDVLHKVHIPTETWPAHDVRKCHVLHVAAEFAPAEERASLHERAAFFFERSLGDVLGFETAHLTRPLVILCVCGFVHSYYQSHPDACFETDTTPVSFGLPQAFVPGRKSSLTDLPGRVRVLLARVLRASSERLNLFGRYSTPSRL